MKTKTAIAICFGVLAVSSARADFAATLSFLTGDHSLIKDNDWITDPLPFEPFVGTVLTEFSGLTNIKLYQQSGLKRFTGTFNTDMSSIKSPYSDAFLSLAGNPYLTDGAFFEMQIRSNGLYDAYLYFHRQGSALNPQTDRSTTFNEHYTVHAFGRAPELFSYSTLNATLANAAFAAPISLAAEYSYVRWIEIYGNSRKGNGAEWLFTPTLLTAVPEPSALILLTIGCIVLTTARRIKLLCRRNSAG